MQTHILTISGRRFPLPIGVDVDALRDRITTAAQHGGEMVTIPGPLTPTAALITPMTAVFLDILETPQHHEDDDPAPHEEFDLDMSYEAWAD